MARVRRLQFHRCDLRIGNLHREEGEEDKVNWPAARERSRLILILGNRGRWVGRDVTAVFRKEHQVHRDRGGKEHPYHWILDRAI